MKIVMINGQSHKGSTYQTGKMLVDKLQGEVTEFFLPRDFDKFCMGCTQCFMKSESKCPHYVSIKKITEAMLAADVLVFTSPVYVYHATGSMKAFLDHYGYMWMAHRPEERMFQKQAVCIATAAGAGMKSTIKDMSDSLFFWGVPIVYKLGFAIKATSFERIDVKIKSKIDKKTSNIANQIIKNSSHIKVGIKTKGFFLIMRMIQKKAWNPADKKYWVEKGWMGRTRPWKS